MLVYVSLNQYDINSSLAWSRQGNLKGIRANIALYGGSLHVVAEWPEHSLYHFIRGFTAVDWIENHARLV